MYVCANAHATAHVRRSEDNLHDSVLTMWVPRMELGSPSLVASSFSLLSHHIGSSELILLTMT